MDPQISCLSYLTEERAIYSTSTIAYANTHKSTSRKSNFIIPFVRQKTALTRIYSSLFILQIIKYPFDRPRLQKPCNNEPRKLNSWLSYIRTVLKPSLKCFKAESSGLNCAIFWLLPTPNTTFNAATDFFSHHYFGIITCPCHRAIARL